MNFQTIIFLTLSFLTGLLIPVLLFWGKPIPNQLLDIIRRMLNDEQLVKSILELIIKISDTNLSGVEKKQRVISELGSNYQTIDSFTMSRVIDIAVTYLKLRGKI